ncbi:serine hydrolase domain-containing protein [Fimbriimonas ginsengisoli]|uniref:Beta-lactamase n=1 Tax=Fimbriimonas ginsengisoli Gsoil 348 TaxID=661478 RepID=A0A068NQS4_FIMGI|nr:serine hydrolase [Fimbriimonas ginsengisoli]AIE83949.1 beta-lactamase [Fimbriimonas ginsengisoli Gsoil 348]
MSRYLVLFAFTLLPVNDVVAQDIPKNDPLLNRPRIKAAIDASNHDKTEKGVRLLRAVAASKRSTVSERYAAHALLGIAALMDKKEAEAGREIGIAAKLFSSTGLPKDYWLQNAIAPYAEILRPSGGGKFAVTIRSASALKAVGVDPEALKTLAADAEKSHSDSLVVWRDGKPLLEAHTGTAPRRMELASVTKSISSSAVMLLLDDHKIDSIDQPLSDFFPQWRNIPANAPETVRRRSHITLRHVLGHTSGIETEFSDGKIPMQPNAFRYALESPVVTEPGQVFNYNNRAANLVSGLVRRITGLTLQAFLKKRIFDPLAIDDYFWMQDRAGNGYVYGGLSLRANDLAKIGQLLLDGGVWQGRRLISRDRIEQFTIRSSQARVSSCALFWWIDESNHLYRLNEAQLAEWRKEGISEKVLASLQVLRGKWLNHTDFEDMLRPNFSDYRVFGEWYKKSDWTKADRIAAPDPDGFNGNGSLGQYLVVVPNSRLVVVRQISRFSHKSDADDFPGFAARVQSLVHQ